MKKTINKLIIVTIIILGLIILVGCNKDNKTENNVNTEKDSSILSLELSDDEYIQVRVDYPKNDDIEIITDEYEKNVVKIKNEKKNYELRLSLGDEVETTYLENQKVDKEEEEYTSGKYADNDGYYYLFGKTTVMGNVLIDTQTDNVYKFVFFELSSLDNESEALPIFKDKEIQDILSSFGFRYKTGSIDEIESSETSDNNKNIK